MLQTGQYQIGLTSTMLPLCQVLFLDKDPRSDFVEYTDVVGQDLNGMPIEAGFPRATWHWDERMSQTDFNILLDYYNSALNAVIYIRTRNNSGGGSERFANYTAIMGRPKGEFGAGDWSGVSIEFYRLEVAP